MGSLGLYDMDMMTYIHVPFNLEIMKIAAYYRKKKIITIFTPNFVPERYSDYIVRKDYNDGNFPAAIYTTRNVQYGGYAFTNGVYVPLDPEIENMAPDKTVYNKIEPIFCNTKKNTTIFKRMLHAHHLRLSLDGVNVAENFDRYVEPNTSHGYYFHDFNLNAIQDADKVIQDLIDRTGKNTIGNFIGNKFPIQAYCAADIYRWSEFNYLYKNFNICYFGLIEDEVLYNLAQSQLSRPFLRQLDYMVTHGCSSEDDFVKNRLPKIFVQATFLRNNRIPSLLKYEDDFFIDQRWCRLIQLINAYVNNIFNVKVSDSLMMTRAIEYETLYSFVKSFEVAPKYSNRTFDLEEVRDIFQMVREQNYEVFKNFYDMSKVIYEGGKLINGTTKH